MADEKKAWVKPEHSIKKIEDTETKLQGKPLTSITETFAGVFAPS